MDMKDVAEYLGHTINERLGPARASEIAYTVTHSEVKFYMQLPWSDQPIEFVIIRRNAGGVNVSMGLFPETKEFPDQYERHTIENPEDDGECQRAARALLARAEQRQSPR